MDNLPVLRLIANGLDMWDETGEENGALVAFKRLFYTKFAGLASVNQMLTVGSRKLVTTQQQVDWGRWGAATALQRTHMSICITTENLCKFPIKLKRMVEKSMR